jgi:hypothetical protein
MPVPGGAADHVIDLDRYPLGEPADPRLVEVVRRVHADLAADGCSVIPEFVRPAQREVLRRESAEIAPLAYFDVETVNVYNTAPDPGLPEGHPARTTMLRGNAFVARDLIPADSVLARLYHDPGLQRFVAACFGLDRVHELADPLSGLVLNVLQPGRGHPWHFDTNEFTVSMLTQLPQAGGEFDYCPQIRSATDENLGQVAAVLDGHAPALIRTLQLRPGDLQLFRGRYSLHRVRPVAGDIPRLSAILAYSERPGVVGSAERTRQLFGRLAPAHADRRAAPVRGAQLLDRPRPCPTPAPRPTRT